MRILFAVLISMMMASAAAADGIPPYGWLRHCGLTQHPGCRLARDLTPEDLAWVHAGLAGQIAPDPDVHDVWELFPPRGDCEDHVLSARAVLMAYGLSASQMAIVIGWARLPEAEGPHAVLEVRLGADVWVIDSAADHVYAADARPYQWAEQARHDVSDVKWRTRDDH